MAQQTRSPQPHVTGGSGWRWWWVVVVVVGVGGGSSGDGVKVGVAAVCLSVCLSPPQESRRR